MSHFEHQALADAPLARQLEELDLSMGTMSDDGARALVEGCAAFQALTRLDVSQNYLSDDAIAMLRSTFRKVVADDQGPTDPDDRFPTVGE